MWVVDPSDDGIGWLTVPSSGDRAQHELDWQPTGAEIDNRDQITD